jgi:hypothetical protein
VRFEDAAKRQARTTQRGVSNGMRHDGSASAPQDVEGPPGIAGDIEYGHQRFLPASMHALKPICAGKAILLGIDACLEPNQWPTRRGKKMRISIDLFGKCAALIPLGQRLVLDVFAVHRGSTTIPTVENSPSRLNGSGH